MSGPETITLAGLPRGQLEALTEQLLAEKAALKQAVAELRAEVASLKGLKGRPRMKPSGMDQATEPGFAAKGQGRGAKGSKSERLRVDKEQVIKAAVPAGSRFKGYQDFLIQDLVLRPCVVRIRRERWLTPDGRTTVAPLPAGIVGHFGPELRRFALFPYHQGQVTVPRLVAQLGAVGIAISKRRVVRLLDEGQGIFLDAARDVLRAGPGRAGDGPFAGTAVAPAIRCADRIIFRRRPGFAKLDRLLARLHANKQEPLLVLDRPAGDSAAHQRLGARPAPAGGQTEALRRHAVGRRPRLPRRLPRSAADLRQARRVVLELSRPPLRRARGRSAVPARSRQAPLSPSLSARAFAPRTAALT